MSVRSHGLLRCGVLSVPKKFGEAADKNLKRIDGRNGSLCNKYFPEDGGRVCLPLNRQGQKILQNIISRKNEAQGNDPFF